MCARRRPADVAAIERLPSHQGNVGGVPIARALPTAQRRTIGAWCFLDHAGPARLADRHAMRVAPHPHTGLQTFSWMMDGEILHRDSLGTVQRLLPGQVNLMTAGAGICHSEESQTEALHLAQLWIALPAAERFRPASFEHHAELPQFARGGFDITVLVGEHEGLVAPPTVYTPLLGLDLCARGAADIELPLRAGFEHGLMATDGAQTIEIDGATGTLAPGELLYLEPGAKSLRIACAAAARLLLLGGAPLPDNDKPLLWWNFVGRTPAEIERFAADWNAGRGDFGAVTGYDGDRLLAPAVPHLRAR